jgi:hypothetical protein
MKRPAQLAALAAAFTALALWLAWTTLTLVFSNLQPEGLRQALAGGYAAALLGIAVFVRPRKRCVMALVGMAAVLSAIYFALPPSNDRTWTPDVAVAATAEVSGDLVTIHGVRNFRYASDEDFEERWEDRTYDLSKLRTLDLFMSYWGPTDYCHTIVSFGFEGGQQLAVSAEVRKEEGESFSTLGGFFKMFELSYVFADERDVVGVRARHRGEDVYLYRLRAGLPRLREVFLSYVEFADELAREPQFYDVLDNSCGVNILHRIGETGRVPWAGKEALLNGYWDSLMYKNGAIHQGLPFDELRALSHVNDEVIAAGDAEDFSAQIRVGLPPAPAPETATGN